MNLRMNKREGWLIDGSDYLAWRFHMDDSAWARDPKDFLDRGRAMLDGPPLLKERRHLSKEAAEQLQRSFRLRVGARQTRLGVLLLKNLDAGHDSAPQKD